MLILNSMKKFLIVGLGNIGEAYEGTRHNIGFTILDSLAKQLDAPAFEEVKHGTIARATYKGKSCLLLKPNTFMNLSGKAVSYHMQQEKIGLDQLLIVTDDLNLPFGTIRIKPKGSDGGHNGLKDIQTRLGTVAYPRFRFGIGNTFEQGRQVDFVLGKWTSEEQSILDERLNRSAAAIQSFVFAGLAQTMNTFNNS